MLDRAESGLRGQVRTCSLERDYVYPDHHWVMHTDDTFSLAGHLLERRHRNPDGSEWSHRLPLRRARQNPGEGAGQSTAFVSVRFAWPAGTRDAAFRARGRAAYRVRAICSRWDQDKHVLPAAFERHARGRPGACSADSMLHVSLDAVAIITVFDASDHPIRKVLYNADDRVIRRVAFRYDQGGLLLEEGRVDRRIHSGRLPKCISIRRLGAADRGGSALG